MPLVIATNHLLTITKKTRINWTNSIQELQTMFKAIVSLLIKLSKLLLVWTTMQWLLAHNHWHHRIIEVKSITEKIHGLSTQVQIHAIILKLNLEVTHEIIPKLSNVPTMKETSISYPTSSTLDQLQMSIGTPQLTIGILVPTLLVKQWTSHRSQDHLSPSEKLTMDSYHRASTQLCISKEEKEHPMVLRNIHQNLVAMHHPTLIKELQQVIHPKVQVDDQALWLKIVTRILLRMVVATKTSEANLPATKKSVKILRWFDSNSVLRIKTWVANKIKWVQVSVLRIPRPFKGLTLVLKSMAVLKMHTVVV